jgi:hypothetical protein
MQGAEAPVVRNRRLTCASTRGCWDIILYIIGDARTCPRMTMCWPRPAGRQTSSTGAQAELNLTAHQPRKCVCVLRDHFVLLSQHAARLSNLRGGFCTSTPSMTDCRVCPLISQVIVAVCTLSV